MTKNTDKNLAASRVAVVADQSDDGSFELRVERSSDSARVVLEPSSGSQPRSNSALKTDTVPPAGRTSKKLALVAGGVAAVGIVGTFAFSVGGAGSQVPEPPLVEAEPPDTFRAFIIQTPEANLPRAILEADVGADTVAEERELVQSPQSPPPAEPAEQPEPIPAANPAAVPYLQDDFAQRLQNVRVSAAPVAERIIRGDDEAEGEDYDYIEDYDEYDDEGEYDDEEFE